MLTLREMSKINSDRQDTTTCETKTTQNFYTDVFLPYHKNTITDNEGGGRGRGQRGGGGEGKGKRVGWWAIDLS